MSDTNILLREARNAIKAIHKAFGAPGDYGYGTAQGQALFDLYKVEAAIAHLTTQEIRKDHRTTCQAEGDDEMCDRCDCWKQTRANCS